MVKELISPEFPIRVRLLGVRATKLRDLRAMSENRGIKRVRQPKEALFGALISSSSVFCVNFRGIAETYKGFG